MLFIKNKPNYAKLFTIYVTHVLKDLSYKFVIHVGRIAYLVLNIVVYILSHFHYKYLTNFIIKFDIFNIIIFFEMIENYLEF